MNGQRVLLAGVHGFVGARTLAQYPQAIPVPGELLRQAGGALDAFVQAQHPDVIVNAAAISDIGTCEKDPDASYTANVMLPVVLARAAKRIGAKLLSFSTDQVYTGCADNGPYVEGDVLPESANVYARHKLEAEERVLDLDPDAVMLRATWMYDMPLHGHANRGNFLVNVLQGSLRGECMQFPARQYRGITYVRQVVSLLEQAAQLPGGVYNYGSENQLTVLETAEVLLHALGLADRIPQLLADSGQARHNLWMDCGKLRGHGIHFDTTAEGLRRCIADYGLKR